MLSSREAGGLRKDRARGRWKGAGRDLLEGAAGLGLCEGERQWIDLEALISTGGKLVNGEEAGGKRLSGETEGLASL